MKKILIVLVVTVLGFSSCSSDDNEQQPINQSHILEFITEERESWESAGLTTTITFEDGTQSIISSDYDYSLNIVSVEIPENTTNFELVFYMEESSETEMRLYGSEDDITVYQETINQQTYQFEYSF